MEKHDKLKRVGTFLGNICGDVVLTPASAQAFLFYVQFYKYSCPIFGHFYHNPYFGELFWVLCIWIPPRVSCCLYNNNIKMQGNGKLY